MWLMNWKALENFPLLMYILAAKTLILCLAFAGAKIYQRKRLEEKMKKEEEEKLKRGEKKEN
ncbi:small integral membrane protein 11 [Zootoca vivipara]|uniref:small integral membrane protein 11 n=1 Tax=Zootoca vivipara TaxID=8524 RepID=UPI001591FE66|nr:small integral membrane protein 11 [Zootoca vivipara]XP_034971704.1 small integral membrane protein 11 [Zootoca vivipara]XP_034971705.1 small integral membrane protein 11 [Zootoca vivipara]XP_034971706.1 small integral membrane protein 11A isoform X2 [Zootoca vivipara]XP_034971707.1 small integral membrane protein 11 [Zootoca vivipara]XP_060129572.1 small integral membrane protein 11 [Zootoca vivipara]